MAWLLFSVVIVVFSLQKASAIPLHDFYPYGTAQGDRFLPSNDDGSTGAIIITVPFPFFGRDYDTIFVNNNGVISFTRPVSTFTPEPFPLGDSLELIAPYWADVDTRGTGQVWYRETANPDLLDRALREIRRVFAAQENFTSTNLFIATWDHVGYFASHVDKTNTFQCVMVTDGTNSFVIFLYADNGIQWTTGDASDGSGGFGGTPAHVGFNAGDGIRSATVPASRTVAIVDIETTSNVGVAGMWVLQVDEEELEFDGCFICTVQLTPHYGNQLGGAPIIVSGSNVTFREEDDITCVFGDREVKGVYVNEEQALCVSPQLSQMGMVLFQLQIARNDFRGEANFLSLPFEKAFEAYVESEQPVFESGTIVTVYWSPQSIFPLSDQSSYTVDVTLRELDMDANEWKTLATLASDLPNNGEAEVTVPELPIVENFEDSVNPVVVEVGVSSASMTDTRRGLFSKILSKIGRFGLRILKQTPMRIAKKLIRQAAQRAACEAWSLTQADNVGQEINGRLPPCPCTAENARAPNSGFKEERLSSIVKVVGRVQNFFDTTIADDAFRNYFHPGAASCYRQRVDIPSLTGGSGQQCCYDRCGDIIVGQPGGGTVDQVSPDVSVTEHFFKDVLPFWLCCKAGFFSNCGRYYQNRPSDDCSEFVPPSLPARARGDPHLVTLDGYKYTFNGRGEFTLIEISNDSFTLQGRMVDITNQNGVAAGATVFSAIVAREGDSDIVQFEVSDNESIAAFVNGQEVDFVIVEQQFTNVTVTDLGNKTLSATFSSGAYLEVQQGNSILSSVVVSLPESYKDIKTQGLLGTYNGDTSDDLQPKSGGTPLPSNSTLQEIHELFGLSWIIDTPRESLFSYLNGQTWATYYSPLFQPVFQPVFQDTDLEMEANRLCGDDQFCLFDIAATGNAEIGLGTLHTSLEIEELEKLSLPIVCDPPCENGACVANDTCACSEGFSGDKCTEKLLMECEGNPCENGGTCTRHVSDYTCTCPPGYSGFLCEVEQSVPDTGVFANDTLTGDPLMTVPIFNDPNVIPGDSVPSLCYEVHGESNAYFNLITDTCTSVNAYYQRAPTLSPNIDLNVVTQIGVKAVGEAGMCWDIQFNLDGMCNATVNGGKVPDNTFDGISVKSYSSSRRVRISVPNCADTKLVMWVFCRDGQVEDPVTWEYFGISFIRYVVMRGLNLDEKSHGLIGQFWNVPVTVEPYSGDFNGEQRNDDYKIIVDHPDSDERSFIGLRADVTWELEKRVCYYVGNRQGGKLAEVTEPNDSVIEGEYSDYKVESLFSTDFAYTHFDADRC